MLSTDQPKNPNHEWNMDQNSPEKPAQSSVHHPTSDAPLGKPSQNVELLIYKCQFPECLLRFTSQQSLKEHQIAYSHEKPFKCSYEGCDKSYQSRDSLYVHYDTHLGIYFACNFPNCSKKLNRRSNIIKHQKKDHTPEEREMVEKLGRTYRIVEPVTVTPQDQQLSMVMDNQSYPQYLQDPQVDSYDQTANPSFVHPLCPPMMAPNQNIQFMEYEQINHSYDGVQMDPEIYDGMIYEYYIPENHQIHEISPENCFQNEQPLQLHQYYETRYNLYETMDPEMNCYTTYEDIFR